MQLHHNTMQNIGITRRNIFPLSAMIRALPTVARQNYCISLQFTILPWCTPCVYVYVYAAFNNTAHPSCAHGYLSTRVNGVELRQRNNSFVRITSTGVRYTLGPTFNNFISTRRLSRPFGRARFGHVKSHERTPNSRRTVKWIDLIHPRRRYPCACGKKTMTPLSSPSPWNIQTPLAGNNNCIRRNIRSYATLLQRYFD